MVNPLVLRIAERRHMPILGIVHHRGRKTGRPYATPLGMRLAPGGGFVMPLTFSQASQWHQNILAADGCVITYRGADHTVTGTVVVDLATAGPGYPRYERLTLRLTGINEFLWLADGRAGPTRLAPGPRVLPQANPWRTPMPPRLQPRARRDAITPDLHGLVSRADTLGLAPEQLDDMHRAVLS